MSALQIIRRGSVIEHRYYCDRCAKCGATIKAVPHAR